MTYWRVSMGCNYGYNPESYRKWYDRNREKKKAQSREYYRTHRKQQIASTIRREKERKAGIPPKHKRTSPEEKRRRKLEREIYYKRRDKKEAIEHYGGKCVCCGESRMEFLTIHHSRNDGAEHRRKLRICGGHFYAWLRKNNFPQNLGLEVMCFNCNCALAFYGYCPHKTKKGFLRQPKPIA